MIRKVHETCVIICEFDLPTGNLRDRRFKGDVEGMTRARNLGCSLLDRGIRLRCRKHIMVISLLQNCHIRFGLNPEKGAI